MKERMVEKGIGIAAQGASTCSSREEIGNYPSGEGVGHHKRGVTKFPEAGEFLLQQESPVKAVV